MCKVSVDPRYGYVEKFSNVFNWRVREVDTESHIRLKLRGKVGFEKRVRHFSPPPIPVNGEELDSVLHRPFDLPIDYLRVSLRIVSEHRHVARETTNWVPVRI